MPGRKLFVSLGAFGFFQRNVIVFKSVGGKGGRGGVNHRILVELRDRRLSDCARFKRNRLQILEKIADSFPGLAAFASWLFSCCLAKYCVRYPAPEIESNSATEKAVYRKGISELATN